MAESEEVRHNRAYSDPAIPDFHDRDKTSAPTFPGYSSAWTQFSGIPPAEPNHHGFKWDAFVTPPPTHSPGPTFDVRTSTADPFFSRYHSDLHGVSGGSPTHFDADQREADNVLLASTPVAQSLIEASLNSSLSPNALQDGPMAGPGPFTFQDASQEGYDMYIEAMKKWGAFQSYSPFGTSDALNTSPDAQPDPHLDPRLLQPSPPSPPPVADDIPISSQEPEGMTTASNSSKPSYSEVAKTLKSKPSSHKDKDEHSSQKKKHTELSGSKPSKLGKKFVPRPVRGGAVNAAGTSGISDAMDCTVSPGSKYGLDQFEEIPGSRESEKEEVEHDVLQLRRKGSSSSLSSGTSGIEDIQLPRTTTTYLHSSQNSVDKNARMRGHKEKSKTFLNDEELVQENNVKPFFDARRIFQSKETNKSSGSSSKKVPIEEVPPSSTVLNNGKPSYSAWCSTKKNTHYINNDLRDSRKKTNQNPSTGTASSRTDNGAPSFTNSSGRGSEKRVRAASSSSSSTSASGKNDGQSKAKQSLPLQTTFDQELIDEWLSYLYEKVCVCLRYVWTLVFMLILLLFSIVVYIVSACVQGLGFLWSKLRHFIGTKIFKGNFKWSKRFSETPKKYGLEENITLPSTGDEAMQRLLACKGKDPYSILGLKSTATDEDIKKYYRRQAVLVHPDKNQQPGAEEAFKILGHAFDLIGDASKRKVYDRQLHEASEAEAAMREFNDLLTKLQEKIHEAANMMRCDNCGGKHKRTPIDRPWYSARFCDRCSIRHSAKEGDVWAETSMLGFLWHYYACMEGKVYDITEWVACKKDFFKHMQANAHHVFYRIATDGNRGQQHGRSGTGEADLEDFISHLFHQAMNNDGNTQWQPPQQSNNNTGAGWNSTTNSTGATNQKRNKRRKRKH